jgi:hypothetical protein
MITVVPFAVAMSTMSFPSTAHTNWPGGVMLVNEGVPLKPPVVVMIVCFALLPGRQCAVRRDDHVRAQRPDARQRAARERAGCPHKDARRGGKRAVDPEYALVHVHVVEGGRILGTREFAATLKMERGRYRVKRGKPAKSAPITSQEV